MWCKYLNRTPKYLLTNKKLTLKTSISCRIVKKMQFELFLEKCHLL